MKTLCRTRGLANDLIVTRSRATITLWSEKGIRLSVFDIGAPHQPGLEYARNMLAALAFCPQAQSCLVLGLGGGSIPRMLLRALPQIEVDAVEIDPAVVELAVTYFDIRALPRLAIHLEDAAGFLKRCTSRYGIVIVDAYLGDQFPDQCATKEFIQDARRCLLDNGVLAVNWLSRDKNKQEDLLRKIESLVGPVWQLPCIKSHNLLYFAPVREVARSEITSAAASLKMGVPFENALRKLVLRLKHSR